MPPQLGGSNTEEKIKKIDEWKEASLSKASDLRPAEKEDFKVHLEAIANQFIREEVA